MSDEERMAALRERLEAAKARAEPEEPGGSEYHSMADVAWRMVLELVAGIAFGFGIGLGLDTLFGTTPIFLVLFLMFGLAGGVSMLMRTARELQEKQAAQMDEAAEEETRDG
ncbi:MAG: AtpZ/AtpI family protein [Pseudomonadota bacterium]